MEQLPETEGCRDGPAAAGAARAAGDRSCIRRAGWGFRLWRSMRRLSDAFAQTQVSTTYMPLNQYHVVMEVAPEFQQDPDALKNIYVKSTTGAMVPLSAVTHFETQRIPLAVNHQSQSPATTL